MCIADESRHVPDATRKEHPVRGECGEHVRSPLGDGVIVLAFPNGFCYLRLDRDSEIVGEHVSRLEPIHESGASSQ